MIRLSKRMSRLSFALVGSPARMTLVEFGFSSYVIWVWAGG